MSDRYENIPLSDKTREGMSLNIDDLGAIGRMLSLQDHVYEEQFDDISRLLKQHAKLMEGQQKVSNYILAELKSLKADISELSKKVDGLENKVGEITRIVDNTKMDVSKLQLEVETLKQRNSFLNIVIRIGVGLGLGFIIMRWIHGPF